jgi:hypothetical protein
MQAQYRSFNATCWATKALLLTVEPANAAGRGQRADTGAGDLAGGLANAALRLPSR